MIYQVYITGLRKAIHWPKSVFSHTHTKSSDTTPNHEEIRSIVLRLSQKNGQFTSMMSCCLCLISCPENANMTSHFSCAAAQFSWVTGEWYFTIFHIFSWIELFIQLILGEWKHQDLHLKFTILKGQISKNPVTPDSTKRAYRLWTPTCLQGADLGTSGTVLKNWATPRFGGEGWGIRYYNSKVFCRFEISEGYWGGWMWFFFRSEITNIKMFYDQLQFNTKIQ